MNKSIGNIIKNIAKNTNPNYKLVKQGKRQKYNSDEMIYTRILKKTDNTELAERWLQLKRSPNWKDKVRAERIAIHLQCLK